MRIIKKKMIVFAAFGLLLAAGAVWGLSGFLKPAKNRKLNVLILSVCSLKYSELPVFAGERDTAPNLKRFTESAFVFKNAFNDKSWSNVSGFLRDLSPAYLERNGYTAIGKWQEWDIRKQRLNEEKELPASYYIRLPLSSRKNRDQDFWKETGDIKKTILSAKGKPFLLEVHSKFLHAPYGVPFYGSDDSGDKGIMGTGVKPFQYMSKESLRLYREYLDHPERHKEKIPLFLTMGRFPQHLDLIEKNRIVYDAEKSGEYKIDRDTSTWMGWLNNPIFLQKWKRSPGFENDLAMVRELYAGRLRFHDAAMGPFFDLFEDRELRDNTVVIFTGDHGEEFFEHGGFTHGNSVYDEAIRFPLAIHFPGQKGRIVSDKQFYQGSLLRIVKDIIEGRITRENYQDALSKIEDEATYARNCNNNVRAVRYKNSWKLIKNLVSGGTELYDLLADPSETRNLFGTKPEMESRLEELLLRYDGSGGNAMTTGCGED